MKYLLLILLFFTFFLCLPIPPVLAQARIISPNYEVQFPNLNSGAGVPESANYSLNTTIGKINGVFSSGGFVIKAGFQYISTIIPFSFAVSKTAINFGTLIHDTPKTDTTVLTVKAGGAGGYQVKAYENHPLQISPGHNIIDTLCNSGCDEDVAALWDNPNKYGFGFNMWGDDLPDDFDSQNHFRQFADISTNEEGTPIMAKTHVTYDYPSNAWPWESESTVTFKVNVGPLQEAGTYQNTVTFVAIPSF
jgi:hypothetical protein